MEHTAAGDRVQSVDILRGFDMFWISGGDTFFHALAVAMGWSWALFCSHQLSHSKWVGVTFFDLIQPLSLFITGITLTLSVSRRLARGRSRGEILRRLLMRALLLIVLGHLDKNGAIFSMCHTFGSRVVG